MQIILTNLFVAAILLVVFTGCLGQTGFCNEAHRKNPNTQVMEICTDQASRHSTVFIDTFQVSKFQDIICECNITPPGVDIEFYFSFYNTSMSVAKGMSFRIHTLVLNEIKMRGALYLSDVTSLRFFTSEQFENGGACLIVKTAHGPFDINCAQPETNSSQDVNKETHGYDYYITLIVLPVLGGSVIVILTAIFVICMKRHQRPNNQSNRVSMSDLVPNTEQREFDTNTNEIPDQNVYEGLDRQESALPGDTYQHLYTETNNSHGKSQYLNLSNPQSDTNTLENEYKNTSGKGSFGDDIRNKNSSYEYESYKTDATDQMYETLQTDT